MCVIDHKINQSAVQIPYLHSAFNLNELRSPHYDWYFILVVLDMFTAEKREEDICAWSVKVQKHIKQEGYSVGTLFSWKLSFFVNSSPSLYSECSVCDLLKHFIWRDYCKFPLIVKFNEQKKIKVSLKGSHVTVCSYSLILINSRCKSGAAWSEWMSENNAVIRPRLCGQMFTSGLIMSPFIHRPADLSTYLFVWIEIIYKDVFSQCNESTEESMLPSYQPLYRIIQILHNHPH